MGKTYSKSALSKKATDYFKQYPDEAFLYATTDGQFFLSDKRNPADLHAKQNKLKVYKIERPEEKASAASDDGEASTANRAYDALVELLSGQKADERIETIKEVENIDFLNAIKESEKAKTVLAVIEIRIEELGRIAELEKED